MVVKNIDELIKCMLNDYSNEERIEFHESFDKHKIYEELIKKENLTPEEMYLLADLYFEGLGVEKDYSKAMEYHQKALELGVKKSAEEIGSLYADGNGVPENIDEAKKYFEIAANANYAFSWYNLGMIYLSGFGSTPKDEVKGIECLKKAADIGFRKAMETIGKCYFNEVLI